MKKRRLFVVIVCAVVVITASWRWAFPNREPLHKGKPISYWVNLACDYGLDYQEDIRIIGAPAVPYLVKKLTMKNNPLRDTASSLYQELPTSLQQRVPYVARSDMVRLRAAWALSWLGSDAKPAVPELAKLISDPSTAEMSMAWALRAIGPAATDAIPALHAALTNQSMRLRVDVAWAIWSITRDTNLVLQICTNAITTGQADIAATWVLEDMGPSALETAPLMLSILQDTRKSERLRSTAALALGKMTGNTRETLAALTAGMGDEMPLVRLYSSIALWKNDSQFVSIATPKIIEAMIATDQNYGEAKEDFVQIIGAYELDAKASVPFLNQLLGSGSPKVREAVLAALRKIQTKPIADGGENK